MKTFLVAMISAVLGLGLLAETADARRLGGAKSFGMQRQVTPPPTAPAKQAAPAQPSSTQAAQPGSRPGWLGPLAGLAAGLGLAALFSHLGLGEEFGAIVLGLLLALAAFMLLRALFRRQAARQDLGFAGASAGVTTRSALPSGAGSEGFSSDARDSNVAFPPGFDADAFSRQAKLNFIRMQAANDGGNLADLREFTTPEVFAELQMQIGERGAAENKTDVVTLNAEVLEVVEEPERYVVSVRFSGTLREITGGAPEPFDEIWHLTKPRAGGQGWLVAGIQQIA